MSLAACAVRVDKSEKEAYQEYDRRTNQKMRSHNKAGGDVRKPVRKVKEASDKDKWDRAKFNSRKASQILSQKQPLVDDKGNPTPAALQFRRWAEKVPRNYEDVKAILSRANRQKERYRPDSWGNGYEDVMGDRLDQRGQGVPCGSSWISRAKKCSKQKAAQTPDAAKKRGAEKARDRLKLKRQIEKDKGKKASINNPLKNLSESNDESAYRQALSRISKDLARYYIPDPPRGRIVAAAWGQEPQLKRVVGKSRDGKEVLLEPVKLTSEQEERRKVTGNKDLYVERVPSRNIFSRSRPSLEALKQHVYPRYRVPRSSGSRIERLPKDIAGPDIIEARWGRRS